MVITTAAHLQKKNVQRKKNEYLQSDVCDYAKIWAMVACRDAKPFDVGPMTINEPDLIMGKALILYAYTHAFIYLKYQ